MGHLDFLIGSFDRALRVIAGVNQTNRPSPGAKLPDQALTFEQQKHSAGLMRVNHVGEVCAQALYEAQGRFSKTPELRAQFAAAAQEEQDHLAWTAARVTELGSHTSLLNPLWFAGAYVMGAVAARIGDAQSLGFVVETERQVEAHLAGHLDDLPAEDGKSRAIVEQMRQDEAEHGAAAQALGAAQTPPAVRLAMQLAAKVMTTTAYRI